jgi:hypothetical protein
LEAIVAAPVWKSENTAVGILHADHVVPSISKKLALTSLTSGGRLVGIVRSQTEAMEFFMLGMKNLIIPFNIMTTEGLKTERRTNASNLEMSLVIVIMPPCTRTTAVLQQKQRRKREEGMIEK